MQVTLERIAQLERELERAKAQLWREDAERYRVVWRELPDEERERIVSGLTDKKERILFGLEAGDEPRVSGEKPGKSGGDLSCEICGKSGLTQRGLGLHKARKHKAEMSEKPDEEPPFAVSGRA